MKKLFVLVFAISTAISAFSQYDAGTLKVSLAMGNSPYTNILTAPNPASQTQGIGVNNAEWVSGKYNSVVNMIGMEFKYFVAPELAIKFIGGGQTSVTPGQNDIPGAYEQNAYDPLTSIPDFTDVKEQTVNQYLFQLGCDKYITRGNSAIYFGLEGGFRYGGTSSKGITETSSGSSISEVYGYHASLNFGAEYGSKEGFFVGVEIRPATFAYNVSTIEPVPGASMKADNQTFGFFTYPMLRLGINF